MSAVARLVRTPPTEEEISLIGHALMRETAVVLRHVERLFTAPATRAELLGVVKCKVPINFAQHEATLKEAERMLRDAPDARFMATGGVEELRAHAEFLREALAAAAPFRRYAQ